MANGKFDAEAIPSWQDACYKLDDVSPLGISHSLWNQISVQEVNAAVYSATPVPDYSSRTEEGGLESPRPKRRRMLEYPEAVLGYGNDFQPHSHMGYGMVQQPCEEPQGYCYPASVAPTSYWYPAAGSEQVACSSTREEAWVVNAAQQEEVGAGGGDCWAGHDIARLAREEGQQYHFVSHKPWPEQGHVHHHIPQRSMPMVVPSISAPALQMLVGGRPGREEMGAASYCSTPCTPVSKAKSITSLPICPFDVVKPLPGVEGNLTLDDINQRISTPKCRGGGGAGEEGSRATSLETGIGLSGKSVVSLRKIHTQGSGSLTIIRTKD